jgi:hypothetical protein
MTPELLTALLLKARKETIESVSSTGEKESMILLKKVLMCL